MEYGIIFEGNSSPLADELSIRLSELGLYRGHTDRLTPELLAALNDYREANRLVVLDFCDPTTLRTLGISCTGDEFITLAGYAENTSKTETQCYDICSELIAESNRLGISITQAVSRRSYTKISPKVSSKSVMCALLAFLDQ